MVVSKESLRQHIIPGEVYRRADLELYSTAIDRHLSELIREGSLLKLNQGLYYAPRFSKFGLIPPDDHLLIQRFVKDGAFLLISPNAFNMLGLGLTQLYNTTWVYNHKRKGEFKLNGKQFEFRIKASFPNKVTREYLLVDMLNNIDELEEDRDIILSKLEQYSSTFNTTALTEVASKYGSGKTKRLIKSNLRKLQRRA